MIQTCIQNDESKAAAMMKRSAYAAECIDCIVRPCVQNPWYCLHSPINVFCMVWSCCHGDPRIGRLKRGNVCMEGVREKEKGAPLACVLTDGLTPEHGTVCYHAYWYAQIVIWLNLLSCHVLLLFFCVCVFFFLILFPFVPSCLAVCLCSHVITSAPVLHLLSGSLALACVCPLVLQFYVRFVRRESLTGINSWRKLKMARGRVTWLMMDTSVETNINVG